MASNYIGICTVEPEMMVQGRHYKASWSFATLVFRFERFSGKHHVVLTLVVSDTPGVGVGTSYSLSFSDLRTPYCVLTECAPPDPAVFANGPKPAAEKKAEHDRQAEFFFGRKTQQPAASGCPKCMSAGRHEPGYFLRATLCCLAHGPFGGV